MDRRATQIGVDDHHLLTVARGNLRERDREGGLSLARQRRGDQHDARPLIDVGQHEVGVDRPNRLGIARHRPVDHFAGKLALHQPLRRRHHAERVDVEQALHLLHAADADIEILGEEREEDAEREARDRAQQDQRPLLRKAGDVRDLGARDDAGVRLLELVLRARHLELIEKVLVEGAVRLGLALEVAQLHVGDAALCRLLLQPVEHRIQAALARLLAPRLASQRLDDLADLDLDLGFEVRQLGLHLDDLRMLVAILGGEIGKPARGIRLLAAKLLDDRRLQHLDEAVVGRAGARAAGLLDAREPRLSLEPLGVGGDGLGRDLRHLLRLQGRRLGALQPVRGTEFLDRVLRRQHLLAQAVEAVGEPDIGPLAASNFWSRRETM